MDKTYTALNGIIRVHDEGVDIQISSRSEQLKYEEIERIEYKGASSIKEGALNIHIKNKKGIRLTYVEKYNNEFYQAYSSINGIINGNNKGKTGKYTELINNRRKINAISLKVILFVGIMTVLGMVISEVIKQSQYVNANFNGMTFEYNKSYNYYQLSDTSASLVFEPQEVFIAITKTELPRTSNYDDLNYELKVEALNVALDSYMNELVFTQNVTKGVMMIDSAVASSSAFTTILSDEVFTSAIIVVVNENNLYMINYNCSLKIDESIAKTYSEEYSKFFKSIRFN